MASASAESLLEPNTPYRFSIDLWATSNVFKAGHRIRLQVTSSNFPRWDRNPNTGHPLGADGPQDLRVAHQSILHDAEHPVARAAPRRTFSLDARMTSTPGTPSEDSERRSHSEQTSGELGPGGAQRSPDSLQPARPGNRPGG